MESKDLRIAIDLRYLHQVYRYSVASGIGGGGVFTAGLWTALAKLFPETEFIAIVEHGPLPNKLLDLIDLAPKHRVLPFGLGGRGPFFGRIDRSSHSWIPRALESRFRAGIDRASFSFDVLHVLNQYPAPLVGVRPTIATIYDLIAFGAFADRCNSSNGERSLIRQASLRLKQQYLRSIDNADCLVTISEATRNDIVRYLPRAEGKIRVIYPGINLSVYKPSNRDPRDIKAQFGLSDDYFIHVGACPGMHGHKNHRGLIEAMRIATQNTSQNFDLVMVGPYRANVNNRKTMEMVVGLAETYKISERVKVFDSINDVELALLYENALALVFPSFYEGFGLPAAEALACGTQCIVSNTTSLPEAVGHLGILIDPADSGAIADAMVRLVKSGKPHSVGAQGPKWAQQFSWDNAAVEYMRLYREMAKNHAHNI